MWSMSEFLVAVGPCALPPRRLTRATPTCPTSRGSGRSGAEQALPRSFPVTSVNAPRKLQRPTTVLVRRCSQGARLGVGLAAVPAKHGGSSSRAPFRAVPALSTLSALSAAPPPTRLEDAAPGRWIDSTIRSVSEASWLSSPTRGGGRQIVCCLRLGSNSLPPFSCRTPSANARHMVELSRPTVEQRSMGAK